MMFRRDKIVYHCWVYVYDSNGKKLFSKFYETIRQSSARRIMNRITRHYWRKHRDEGDNDTRVHGAWDATLGAFDRFLESEDDPTYFKRHFY